MKNTIIRYIKFISYTILYMIITSCIVIIVLSIINKSILPTINYIGRMPWSVILTFVNVIAVFYIFARTSKQQKEMIELHEKLIKITLKPELYSKFFEFKYFVKLLYEEKFFIAENTNFNYEIESFFKYRIPDLLYFGISNLDVLNLKKVIEKLIETKKKQTTDEWDISIYKKIIEECQSVIKKIENELIGFR